MRHGHLPWSQGSSTRSRWNAPRSLIHRFVTQNYDQIVVALCGMSWTGNYAVSPAHLTGGCRAADKEFRVGCGEALHDICLRTRAWRKYVRPCFMRSFSLHGWRQVCLPGGAGEVFLSRQWNRSKKILLCSWAQVHLSEVFLSRQWNRSKYFLLCSWHKHTLLKCF